FFSSRRRHTRWPRDWSSDVCSSDLVVSIIGTAEAKSKVLVARAAAQAERLEDLDFSPRATLCALVERAFPVDLYQQVEDPISHRSEERRVGKEGRSRRWGED